MREKVKTKKVVFDNFKNGDMEFLSFGIKHFLLLMDYFSKE